MWTSELRGDHVCCWYCIYDQFIMYVLYGQELGLYMLY